MLAYSWYKRAFTLVEMLIVIVIIGILAAALIPRFSQARERANDTARKAHLQQVAAVLVAYQIDRGVYPETAWPLSAIEDDLVRAGLSSVPNDPVSSREFTAIEYDSACNVSPAWEYLYTPIRVRGVNNAGFALAAGTQTEGWSNWIFDENDSVWYTSAWCITTTTESTDISYCDTNFSLVASAWLVDLSACEYFANGDYLRYIYTQ